MRDGACRSRTPRWRCSPRLAVESADHEGKRKTESIWPILRINHTRSRYIYDLHYKREAISKELYQWLIKEGYADAACVRMLARLVRVDPAWPG
jgi:hypothetical protein